MPERYDTSQCLPEDGLAGTLIARVWVPEEEGASVALVDADGVFDLSRAFPTIAQLLDEPDPARAARAATRGPRLGSIAELMTNSVAAARDAAKPWLLAPVDLQAVKAAGGTFAPSMLERLVEEQAPGDASRADETRRALVEEIGSDLGAIEPGSETAARLKASLIKRGLWSQYLEVGLGPDAEGFSKCQPMAAGRFGAGVGILEKSTWNNPDQDIGLAV